MHWLIDESKSFIFQSNPPMCWKIATVGGAILSYEGRKTWQRYHKSIKKGSDYKTDDYIEQELEIGLVNNIEKLILELGQGLAFIGR